METGGQPAIESSPARWPLGARAHELRGGASPGDPISAPLRSTRLNPAAQCRMGADSGSRWLGGDPTANAGRASPEVSPVIPVPPAAGSRFPLRTHTEEFPGSGETAAGNRRPPDASAPVLGWYKHPLQAADFLSAWNSSSSLFSFTDFVY